MCVCVAGSTVNLAFFPPSVSIFQCLIEKLEKLLYLACFTPHNLTLFKILATLVRCTCGV